MEDLSKKDFCSVYDGVAGHTDVNFQSLCHVLALTGKPIFTGKIQRMWPENQEFISRDQSYSLYSRYEPPSLLEYINEDDFSKIERCTTEGLLYFLDRKRFPFVNDARSILEEFERSDGTIRMKELLQHIEETRLKHISKLRGTGVSRHKSSFIRKHSLMHESEEQDPIIAVSKEIHKDLPDGKLTTELYFLSFGGFMVVSPQMAQVNHWVRTDHDMECKIALKWHQKSDTATKSDNRNPFLLDAIIVVTSLDGQVLATSDRFCTNESVMTPPFSLAAGASVNVAVVSLGVTSPLRSEIKSERIPLKNEKNITKPFRMSLMNLFEIFDLDGDGLLSMGEYNVFLVFSKDKPIKEEDWISLEQLVEFRHGMMTMTGFVQTFQLEMSSEDRDMLEDMWTSLRALGYDSNLKMVYGCGFELTYFVDKPIYISFDVKFMSREYRDFVLEMLYRKGTVDESCELLPRTYRTEYFGVCMVDRILSIEMSKYRIIWEEEPEVIWHFPNGETGIKPGEGQSEWFMLLSYQTTNPKHRANFRIEKE